MSEHTNGRMSWIRRKDGSLIYVIGNPKNGPHAQGDIYIGEDDLRRMTAAWNACEGISTANLEDNLPVLELAKSYNAAIRQSDDLLAALKEAKAALEFAVEQGGGPQCEHESGGAVCFCRENSAINSARAAIAKAEAGKVGDEG